VAVDRPHNVTQVDQLVVKPAAIASDARTRRNLSSRRALLSKDEILSVSSIEPPPRAIGARIFSELSTGDDAQRSEETLPRSSVR
jgi:hypothetical protein